MRALRLDFAEFRCLPREVWSAGGRLTAARRRVCSIFTAQMSSRRHAVYRAAARHSPRQASASWAMQARSASTRFQGRFIWYRTVIRRYMADVSRQPQPQIHCRRPRRHRRALAKKMRSAAIGARPGGGRALPSILAVRRGRRPKFAADAAVRGRRRFPRMCSHIHLSWRIAVSSRVDATARGICDS